MQVEFIMESWKMNMGEMVMMAHNNNSKDAQQAILRLDRYLRKGYPEYEIPLVLSRHSPILGSSILDYLIGTENSASIILSRLTYESRQ